MTPGPVEGLDDCLLSYAFDPDDRPELAHIGHREDDRSKIDMSCKLPSKGGQKIQRRYLQENRSLPGHIRTGLPRRTYQGHEAILVETSVT